MRILYHKRVYISTQMPWCLFAVSVRLLNPNYTGKCMNVRRDIDDTYKDIGFKNGILDTDDLLDFVGAGSGYIRRWYDQSGNGWNWVSTLWRSRQPRIVNLGVVHEKNGNPTVNFTGTQYFEMATSKTVPSEISIFTAAELTSTRATRLLNNNFYMLLGSDTSQQIRSFYGDGSSWGESTANSTETWLNKFRLVTSINNGYDNQFIDGQTITPRNNPMTSFTGEIAVTIFPPSYFSEPWNGNVSEVIIYGESKLGTRNMIESNINRFFHIY